MATKKSLVQVLDEWEGMVLALVALPALLAAGGVVLFQCLSWLKKGIWKPRHFEEFFNWLGIEFSSTGLLGLDKIIGWVFALPLSGGLVAVGVGLPVIIHSLYSYYTQGLRET